MTKILVINDQNFGQIKFRTVYNMSVNYDLFNPESESCKPHTIANAIRNAVVTPAKCSVIEFYAILEHAAKHTDRKWWAACLRYGRAIWMIQQCDKNKWPEAHEELRQRVGQTWEAFTQEVNKLGDGEEDWYCKGPIEPISPLTIVADLENVENS